MGAESIRVNLRARPLPQTVPATDSKLRAIARVHLTPTLTSDDASTLRHWLGSLDGRYKLTLEGVYEADSTIVLMTMGHALFLKMANQAIELVALVKSHNLLTDTPPPRARISSHSVPSRLRSDKKNERHYYSFFQLRGYDIVFLFFI